MEKVIKDGKVAVLISRGYGAGWYSWNNVEQCIFEPQIVSLVIRATKDGEDLDKHVVRRIMEIADTKYDKGFYSGGADGLTVEWVDEGDQFEIREYDGNESLHVIGKSQYITA